MKYSMELLLAGRSKPELDDLKLLLDHQSGVNVSLRVISNGHADPLHGVEILPDVLVYVVSELWADELTALSSRPASQRPTTLVVGPAGDFKLFRMAMQAGARDFLTLPLSEDELASTLERISHDLQVEKTRKTANMTVVINAKGGSGASMVAANVAYINAQTSDCRTLLVDLDLQFGAIPIYLNLAPNNGLLKALQEVDRLDGLALDGLVLKHASGLHVLATSPEEVMLSEDLSVTCLAALFELLGHSYDELIIDMPRHIDPVSTLILQHADRIVVMMEASLAHVRDAKRLLTIIQQMIGVPRERINVVINRYDKQGSLKKSDICNTLEIKNVTTLPSDFRHVNDSVNVGSPLYETARSVAITKSLLDLSSMLTNRLPSVRKRSGFGQGIFNWMRS